MSSSPGDQLGHYVIAAPLGAGGMGEVYRARDTRLDRDVALKMLPDEVARDPERLARFEREARLLASLNHPNIATLYGIEIVPDSAADPRGEATESTFLAMELVDGQDLAGRIAEGPIPLREAVPVARQIAEGLEAAHDRGIVHRDLKPANVMITAEGTAKILDFGLAKAAEHASATTGADEPPTLTAGLTRAGTTLGTAPYMSPEQAVGKPVDRRTDIWAFGCVLFEMLTGRRAFPGDTPAEILVQILEHKPDWSLLPATVPPALRRLLERCLQKERKQRLRNAGDIALALEDLDLDGLSGEGEIQTTDTPRRNRSAALLPWILTALAAAVAVVAWLGRPDEPPASDVSVLRFTQTSPAPLDISRIGHSGPAVAVSPDGHVLAWIGSTESGTQLFVRHLDEDSIEALADTEGALVPTFSPDSQWIAFWADGTLKKISVRGGLAQEISRIDHPHGISWGNGIIVAGGAGYGSLWRIDPGSGASEQIQIPDDPNYAAGYPRLLPGSKTILVTNERTGSVDLVSLDSGEVRTIASEGTNAHYLPSGHLVWTQKDSLVAAPFDVSRFTITGDTYTVVQGITTETMVGTTSHYSVSPTGTLAYLPGTVSVNALLPVWMNLDGTREPTSLPADVSYLSPRLSPDGQKLLLSRQTTGRSIWLADPQRGFMDPVTEEENSQYWAIWTPDGSEMIFNTQEETGVYSLRRQPVDLSEPPVQLTDDPGIHIPIDITEDGRTLVLIQYDALSEEDLGWKLLHLDDVSEEKDGGSTETKGFLPALSPRDLWIAYVSDVTGGHEVYVQPFPDLGQTVRISSNGGTEPIWSPDGSRIYYRSLDGRRIFAAQLIVGDTLQVEDEQPLFEGNFVPPFEFGRKWDLHPDGDRFLMFEVQSDEPPDGIRVVVNWDAEIEALIAADN